MLLVEPQRNLVYGRSVRMVKVRFRGLLRRDEA